MIPAELSDGLQRAVEIASSPEGRLVLGAAFGGLAGVLRAIHNIRRVPNTNSPHKTYNQNNRNTNLIPPATGAAAALINYLTIGKTFVETQVPQYSMEILNPLTVGVFATAADFVAREAVVYLDMRRRSSSSYVLSHRSFTRRRGKRRGPFNRRGR